MTTQKVKDYSKYAQQRKIKMREAGEKRVGFVASADMLEKLEKIQEIMKFENKKVLFETLIDDAYRKTA